MPGSCEDIGAAPGWLSDELQEVWEYLRSCHPEGHLTHQDRPAAELLCRLWHRLQKHGFDKRHGINDRQLVILTRLLSAFGMTPRDRARIQKRKRVALEKLASSLPQ